MLRRAHTSTCGAWSASFDAGASRQAPHCAISLATTAVARGPTNGSSIICRQSAPTEVPCRGYPPASQRNAGSRRRQAYGTINRPCASYRSFATDTKCEKRVTHCRCHHATKSSPAAALCTRPRTCSSRKGTNRSVKVGALVPPPLPDPTESSSDGQRQPTDRTPAPSAATRTHFKRRTRNTAADQQAAQQQRQEPQLPGVCRVN